MGIIPEAQNSGMGTWFMRQVIEQARAQGTRTLTLEAIEQNERAVKLYTHAGFRILRRLYGYRSVGIIWHAPELVEIDIYEAARHVIEHGLPDLPWQIAGTSLARLTPPNRAYRLDHAYAVISDPSCDTITLRSLFVQTPARLQGEATRLLGALFVTHPGKDWEIPPLSPEEYDGFFVRRGFTRLELHQVQMALYLEH
jgi:N-acetylglutamate synthase-like GNAT family acetyltransferase